MSKKRKRVTEPEATEIRTSPPPPSIPKIQPGERLQDYAARVDQALPVTGLLRKGQRIVSMRERQTKHEKKLQKMVNTWKAEDAKRREREEEEQELAEEAADEESAMWEARPGDSAVASRGRKGRKVQRRGSDDEDPWAQLKAKREAPKGVFDVAQAPPQFAKAPKDFKIKNGAKVNVNDVPNAAGSLRRREQLSEARKDVIARYRQMMKGKGVD